MFATRALRMFRPTARLMRPIPKEEQAAHTVSQRLRSRIKSIPPELYPLGVVVAFAVCAAVYSSTRHLIVDKNIRLKRQNRAAELAAHSAHHGQHHAPASGAPAAAAHAPAAAVEEAPAAAEEAPAPAADAAAAAPAEEKKEE